MENNKIVTISGGIQFVGLLQIVFIVLKLIDEIDWGWGWVLSPTWIPALVVIGFVLLLILLKSYLNNKINKKISTGLLKQRQDAARRSGVEIPEEPKKTFKFKKSIMFIVVCFIFGVIIGGLTGCETEADIVSRNLSLEAENFNIIREVTVIHGFTGDTTAQMTGRLSIEENNGKIVVTVEYAKGLYAKHFFFIGDNGQCLVEQIGPAEVDQYNYTLNMNPKLWLPIKIDVVD